MTTTPEAVLSSFYSLDAYTTVLHTQAQGENPLTHPLVPSCTSRSPTPLVSGSSRSSTPTPVSYSIQRASARSGGGLGSRGRVVPTRKSPRLHTVQGGEEEDEELGQGRMCLASPRIEGVY